MKTTLKTQTYQITITEISPDFDNDTRLEICFETELTRDYLATLPCADDILADLELDETGLTFELNVAQRHDDKLYAIIKTTDPATATTILPKRSTPTASRSSTSSPTPADS